MQWVQVAGFQKGRTPSLELQSDGEGDKGEATIASLQDDRTAKMQSCKPAELQSCRAARLPTTSLSIDQSDEIELSRPCIMLVARLGLFCPALGLVLSSLFPFSSRQLLLANMSKGYHLCQMCACLNMIVRWSIMACMATHTSSPPR